MRQMSYHCYWQSFIGNGSLPLGIRGRMAEWSKAVDSSIIEFFDGIIGFPTYPGFESQFYQIF